MSEFLKRLFVYCRTSQGRMPNTSFLQMSSDHVTKQDQCSGTTQRRVGFSSAGMNRVTESAWAGCWYNCQTAAGKSCCHASSHTRAGAAVGPGGRDTSVTAESCSLCSLTSTYRQLCYLSCTPGVIHSQPDSLLTPP